MALDVQTQHPQSLQESHVSVVPAASSDQNHRKSTTLRLFHHHYSSPIIELEEPSPLPLGCEKFLDLQTGKVYYRRTVGKKQPTNSDGKKKMNRRNGQKVDLKLSLSPPCANQNHLRTESSSQSLTVSPTSPPSSCVSSELNESLQYSSSPETTSMMLVGCPRCLMYVMLSEEDPRCPKCKSTVLLNVIHDNSGGGGGGGRKSKKS